MTNVNLWAWLSLVILTVVMGVLLFGVAGTFDFWQAWVYLAIFSGAAALITLYLIRRDPALLRRRLKGGPTAETRPVEKVIMLATSVGFIALLVVPALDHRYGWSSVPLYAVVAGNALVAIGNYLIFLVYRENTFSSATIEVAADQRVISTGPYAIVRHPMYASGLLYLAGMPPALGSYWAFVPIVGMLPFLVWRLFDEERLLQEKLPGYRAYQKNVRYRLLPGIW